MFISKSDGFYSWSVIFHYTLSTPTQKNFSASTDFRLGQEQLALVDKKF